MSRPKKESVALSLRMDERVFNELTLHCTMGGQSKTSVVERAVTRYLDEQKRSDLNAYEKALKEVERIVVNGENIIERYVCADNNLSVEADADGNDYAYEYTKNLKDMLGGLIVQRAVRDAGYFIDSNDTFGRWRKEV